MMSLADQFIRYMTEVTGWPVYVGEPLTCALPQHLSQLYSLHEMDLGQHQSLGILLKDPERLRPAQFEKDAQRLLNLSGAFDDCCLVADDLPTYVRQRLIERRVSFVIPWRQLHWPALGLAVQERVRRQRTNATAAEAKLSPASQVAILYALNGGDTPVTPTALTQKLGYTHMTWSRALNEIEAANLGRVVKRGKERLLDFPMGRRALWEEAKKYLCSPARKTVRIHERELPTTGPVLAGETALANYSLLSPPSEPVFAMGKGEWKQIATRVQPIPIRDAGTCQVQVWRYDPALFAQRETIDRFSLYLSLQDEADERVLLALDEMMEQTLWS